jgi:hypothetical protein
MVPAIPRIPGTKAISGRKAVRPMPRVVATKSPRET